MDDITFGKYQALRSMIEDFLHRENFNKKEIAETAKMLNEDLYEHFKITDDDLKAE